MGQSGQMEGRSKAPRALSNRHPLGAAPALHQLSGQCHTTAKDAPSAARVTGSGPQTSARWCTALRQPPAPSGSRSPPPGEAPPPGCCLARLRLRLQVRGHADGVSQCWGSQVGRDPWQRRTRNSGLFYSLGQLGDVVVVAPWRPMCAWCHVLEPRGRRRRRGRRGVAGVWTSEWV